MNDGEKIKLLRAALAQYEGPSPDDLRLLIRGMGGTSPTANEAMKLADRFGEWHKQRVEALHQTA